LKSWYILPRSGSMNGFKKFYRKRTKGASLLGSGGECCFVQTLSENSLLPNTEYIVWFQISDTCNKLNMCISLNMFGAETASMDQFFQMFEGEWE
jgi:hypothetical protein